jgi:ribosome-associated protein
MAKPKPSPQPKMTKLKPAVTAKTPIGKTVVKVIGKTKGTMTTKATPKPSAKLKPAAPQPVAAKIAKKTKSTSAKLLSTKSVTAKAVTKALKPAPAPTVKPVLKKSATQTAGKTQPKTTKKIIAKVIKPKSKAMTTPQALPERILAIVLRILDERQAEQIITVDLRGRSSMADYMVIASGRAARQITAIADFIRVELGKLGIKQVRSEGAGEANWVLVDAGDVILHLFRPEVRQFYNIEQIYANPDKA